LSKIRANRNFLFREEINRSQSIAVTVGLLRSGVRRSTKWRPKDRFSAEVLFRKNGACRGPEPGNPWIFSRSSLPCPGATVYQSEHNAEILKELQVSEDKIQDLEKRSITLSRR